MPNPQRESVDWVKADLPNLPAATTVSTSFPTETVPRDVPHIQVAWDGSPTYADNREDATTRVTVWTNPNQSNLAIDVAEGMIARLPNGGTAAMQRIGRGAGRLPGADPVTGNAFCSFTLTPVLVAPAP